MGDAEKFRTILLLTTIWVRYDLAIALSEIRYHLHLEDILDRMKFCQHFPLLPLMSPPLTVGLNWQTTVNTCALLASHNNNNNIFASSTSTSSDLLPPPPLVMPPYTIYGAIPIWYRWQHLPDAASFNMYLQIKGNMLLVRQLWWQQRYLFCVRKSVRTKIEDDRDDKHGSSLTPMAISMEIVA